MEKKSILFIADKPDWAYHHIIKTWSADLQNDFDCFVAFAEDFQISFKTFSQKERLISNNLSTLLGKDQYLRIDESRNFSTPVYKNPPVYEVISQKKTNRTSFGFGVEMAYYFQYISKLPFQYSKKIIGIYTDSFPHEGPSLDQLNNRNLKNLTREQFYNLYLKPYDGIVVGNLNLFADYTEFTDKLVFANGMYRQNEFVENTYVGEKDSLTVGWTGTPDRPMKGFREIIEPAIEEVRKTGRNVMLKTKFTGSYDEILAFFQDVDLVVIASEADTGPSLFAEASLSNVPSVSTEIGFPKMVIKSGENGIIVKRNVEEMKNAVIRLYDDRKLLKSFSQKIKKDYLAVLDNKISVTNLKAFLNKI